jgi:hypothetical protein
LKATVTGDDAKVGDMLIFGGDGTDGGIGSDGYDIGGVEDVVGPTRFIFSCKLKSPSSSSPPPRQRKINKFIAPPPPSPPLPPLPSTISLSLVLYTPPLYHPLPHYLCPRLKKGMAKCPPP